MSRTFVFSALLCITTIVLKSTSSYVLLAANLDDFKKVAKRFVPERMAMQIAEIATSSPMKQSSEVIYQDANPETETARTDYLAQDDTGVQEATEVKEKAERQEDIEVPEYTEVQDEIAGPEEVAGPEEYPDREQNPVQEDPVKEKTPIPEAKQIQERVKHESKYLSGINRQISNEGKRSGDMNHMDFEDLVQKVKQRIQEELLNKKSNPVKQKVKQFKQSKPASNEYDVGAKEQEEYGEDNSEQNYPEKNGESNFQREKDSGAIQESDTQWPISKLKSNNDKPNRNQNIRNKKKSKNREVSRFGSDSNEKREREIHQQDEMDVNGRVIHNHKKYEDKRQVTKQFDSNERQKRTENPDKHKKYEIKGNKSKPKRPQKYTEEVNKEGDEEFSLYSKTNMTKHDSYEDYVTPKKEDNIYSSKESPIKERVDKSKVANDNAEKDDTIPLAADDYEENVMNDDYEDPGDLKARTENMNFDYDNKDTQTETQTEKYRKETTENRKETTPMKSSVVTKKHKDKNWGKATMIPKRDFYKLSTPNYYAKMPIVAEKYDFDEPIPEKDREPEDTRSFPMPPSNINGKVKIN